VTTGEPTLSPQQRLDLPPATAPAISLEKFERFTDEFDPHAVSFVAVLAQATT